MTVTWQTAVDDGPTIAAPEYRPGWHLPCPPAAWARPLTPERRARVERMTVRETAWQEEPSVTVTHYRMAMDWGLFLDSPT
jgi:hypothetical protein